MISILLATFNDERYIAESVNSVLNQTFKDFELLIGFNGTTDKSKEIVSRFQDTRIRIFDYGDDTGKSKTLNKMIGEATYDWAAIQDGDDIWLPQKLAIQFQLKDKYDVIGTYIHYIDEDGKKIGAPGLSTTHADIVSRSLNRDNQIANSSAIFKTEDIQDIQGWDQSLEGIEDYDLWLRLIKKGCIFHNIPEVLVLHRLHTRSNFNTKSYDLEKLFRKNMI